MKNRGITIVSLIITIIVILILSGVGITATLSVINNAKQATFMSKMAAIEEEINLTLTAEEVAYHQGTPIKSKITDASLTLLLDEFNNLNEATKTVIFEQRGETFDQEKTYTDEDISDLFKLGEDITKDESYASIYDSQVGAVYKMEPVIIGGKANVGTGKIGLVAGKRKIIKPEVEDFYINKEFVYTGKEQEVTLEAGTYTIKCYGAAGGYGKHHNQYKDAGGKGAYTEGVLKLSKKTTIYIYVGGKGGNAVLGNGALGGTGGYNGGGIGGQDYSDDDSSGGGGGATDIRLIGGEWNNEKGLRSRIMVAAGGSGSTFCGKGKDGGTLNGISTGGPNPTQTSGNAFGIGGNGPQHPTVPGSGAGGGYYGGFAGQGLDTTTDVLTIGSSGSSFISGYTGCNAVKSENDGSASGQAIHYSGLKFENAVMTSGVNEENGMVSIVGGNYIPDELEQEDFYINKEFVYTGKVQEVNLEAGTYTIKCYGAAGGYGKYDDTYKHEPGKGAYTEGVLELNKKTTMYIYVGGKGGNASLGRGALGGIGGYNGGGTGGQDTRDNDSSGGGGGATDIRLIGGEWNNEKGLRSRIMVAAGGSGSSYCGKGQDGGTLNGISTGGPNPTQKSGNAFGIGGNGPQHTMVPGSGAGGGYYGGFAGQGLYTTTDVLTIGSSGSSFISGYTGCNAVKSETDGSASGQAIHYSGLKFKNAVMTSGVNEENGKVIIVGGNYIP